MAFEQERSALQKSENRKRRLRTLTQNLVRVVVPAFVTGLIVVTLLRETEPVASQTGATNTRLNPFERLPRLNALVSWFGNPFTGDIRKGHQALPAICSDLDVSPDGIIATHGGWNETLGSRIGFRAVRQASGSYRLQYLGAGVHSPVSPNGTASAVAFTPDGKLSFQNSVSPTGMPTVAVLKPDGSGAPRTVLGDPSQGFMGTWDRIISGVACSRSEVFFSDITPTTRPYEMPTLKGFQGISIFRYNQLYADSMQIKRAFTNPPRLLPLAGARRLAVTPDGKTLFVVQALDSNAPPEGAHRILRLDARTGKVLNTVSGLTDPIDVALDRQNRLIVAERSACRISLFDPTGARKLASFGSPLLNGANAGQVMGGRFAAPQAVAVDGANNLYVLDTVPKTWPLVYTIACYPPNSGSTPGWKSTWLWHTAAGIFNESPQFDPKDARVLYTNSARFQLDYAQPGQGREGKLAGVTFDARRKTDPRQNQGAQKMLGIGYVGGRRFAVLNMGAQWGIYDASRRGAGGELLEPVAYIAQRSPQQDGQSPGFFQHAPPGAWVWTRKRSGTIAYAADEFRSANNSLLVRQQGGGHVPAMDANLGLWWLPGDTLLPDRAAQPYVYYWPPKNTLSPAGAPIYDPDDLQELPLPTEAQYVGACAFNEQGDLFVAYRTKPGEWFRLSRFPDWKAKALVGDTVKAAWTVPAIGRLLRREYEKEGHGPYVTDETGLGEIAAAGKYVFVLEALHSYVRVYEAATGRAIGRLKHPGANGSTADSLRAFQVRKLSSGEYAILVGSGHVYNNALLLRWRPPTAAIAAAAPKTRPMR